MNNFFCRPVVLAIFWIVAFARADSSALWGLPPGTTAVVTGTYYHTSLQGVSTLFVIKALLIRSSIFCFVCMTIGGTKGIGKAIVEELALKGSHVLTCSRNAVELEQCVEDWKTQGLDVAGVTADISTKEGREELMNEIYNWLESKKKSKTLDILVNNVGTNIRKPTVEYTPEDIEKIWNTNFHSMFALTVACHPLLKRKPGQLASSVVNIGSVAGVTCMKSGTAYSGTKAAMNQVTGNWACEWGPQGIRVNCVAPWYINTELAKQVLKDKAYHKSVVERTVRTLSENMLVLTRVFS
jgi:Tropinone reductase 1